MTAADRDPPDAPPAQAEHALGLEARAAADDHGSLKLWLRLLACSTQVETEIRRRLRQHFGMSLARFDYLAQVHRHPEGLRMATLSRYLMVTGGNVTALTDDLAAEGWVQRDSDPQDGRSWRVRLTPEGRARFEAAAAVHEGWVIELFAGLPAAERGALHATLGRLREHLARAAPPPTRRGRGRPTGDTA